MSVRKYCGYSRLFFCLNKNNNFEDSGKALIWGADQRGTSCMLFPEPVISPNYGAQIRAISFGLSRTSVLLSIRVVITTANIFRVRRNICNTRYARITDTN